MRNLDLKEKPGAYELVQLRPSLILYKEVQSNPIEEALSIDQKDIDNMSPKDLENLKQKVQDSVMEFMRQNVNRDKQPPSKEVADYVAGKLGMPVELVEYVRKME